MECLVDASVEDKINGEQIALGNMQWIKLPLLGRLGEFNRKVRGSLSHSAFVQALPDAPSATAGAPTILKALDDVASLWPKINAATIPGFTGPLLLLGGYPIATYNTDLLALKGAYKAWQDAEQDTGLERERRNDVQDLAYAILSEYRPAVEGSFAPTHALVATIPRLVPEAGSTPDPVTANVSWDAATGQAKITFSQSTNPNLFQYEIRFCAGPNYSTELEAVAGNILPGAPGELFTLSGLPSAGSTAIYKVYVILTTGNERGSNTVAITRPV